MAGLADISVSNFTKVEMTTDGSPVEITDFESFGGFNEETSTIEVKQYNRKYARKLSGSASVSPVELICSFNPSSASYKALAKARANDTLATFKVTYYNNASKSAASSRTFQGIVTSYSESSEYDAQRTCTWTVAVDGELGALTDETIGG